MSKTLNSLINNYHNFVFVSPHLDDALLSCGELIRELTKSGKKVTVINVFTKAHSGPYTLSGKKYLSSSGNYKNANKLYSHRVAEDKDALSFVKVKKIVNLNLVDALFRKRNKISVFSNLIPEISHLYPTYRWHIIKNKPNSSDDSKKKLSKLLVEKIPQSAVVFSPINIAKHVDHQIAKEVCEENFKNIIFYADFPYSLNKNIKLEEKKFRTLKLKANFSEKSKVLAHYKTQVNGLFANGVMPKHYEFFYLK